MTNAPRRRRILLPFLLALVVAALPGLLAFAARALLATRPAFVESRVSRGLFRVLSALVSAVTGLVPFSLTEAAAVLAPVLLVAGLAVLVVRLVRRKGRRLAILRATAVALAAALSVGYAGFLLLHGYNYLREPFAATSGLEVRERGTDELARATERLLALCVDLRAQCAEDASGTVAVPGGLPAMMAELSADYARLARDYPALEGPRIRPKPVLLSHIWSYTGIVGMYFPFFVEANVNVDVPQYTIPASAAHEYAHALGFAREDEANFIAFLACLRSPSPEVRYSGAELAFVNCWGALAGKDEKAAARIGAGVSAAMRRDFAASGAYWKQFEGPVREASTKTNDAYLKANDQTDGVFSYGRMVDLVLAYDAAYPTEAP